MSVLFKTMSQPHIDWLLARGVTPAAMIHLTIIDIATGTRGADGIFNPDEDGHQWFAIPDDGDVVFWRPRTGELATEYGQLFALGQDMIFNPAVTALDGWLRIFADPLEWLQSARRGIVVLDWRRAFEWLRDVPQIAVAENLLPRYQRHMAPSLPKVGVIPREKRRVAA